LSIINVDGLQVTNSSFRNSNGTAPQAGIDIEPDKPTQVLKRIELQDILLEGNSGCGLEIEFGSYIGSQEAVSIVARNVWSSNNSVGLSVLSNVRLRGSIDVSNLTVDGTSRALGAGIDLVDQSVDGAMVTIRDSLVRRVASVGSRGPAPVMLARHAPPKPSRALEVGQVNLINVTAWIGDECQPFLLANLSHGCSGSSGTGKCGPIELYSLTGSFTVLAPANCSCPYLVEAAGHPKHWDVSVKCIH
jgi:hypothetical protein